jgi:organic radical activating enzyme
MTRKVPPAGPTRTPAQYGAQAPVGDRWPLNAEQPDVYRVAALYPTLQGEGALAGQAMTIVRLQGCPVGCKFCDTPETWAAAPGALGAMHVSAIAASVAECGLPWVLVTGGEPTWHDLTALTAALADQARSLRHLALETAGVYPLTGQWNWVTLSPKPEGRMVFRREWLQVACEVKWIVGTERDVHRLEAFEQVHRLPELPGIRVSVQPMSASPAATRVAVDAVAAHASRWRLSLQTHRLIGIA